MLCHHVKQLEQRFVRHCITQTVAVDKASFIFNQLIIHAPIAYYIPQYCKYNLDVYAFRILYL